MDESIFDKKALDERKKAALSHQPKKRKEKKAEIKREPRWFELPLTMESFERKEDTNGKHYARHNEWEKTIFIGPYNSAKELDDILKSYITNSKKPVLKRKDVKNFHSIVIDEDKQSWKD